MREEEEGYTKLGDSEPRHRHSHRVDRSSWWVYGWSKGVFYILGVSDEEEGNQKNWSKYDGNGTVVELPTIDERRATRMIKKRVENMGKSLEEATQRARHKITARERSGAVFKEG